MDIKALSFCMDCFVHCSGRSCERECYPIAEEMFGSAICPAQDEGFRDFLCKVSDKLKEVAEAVPDSDIDVDTFVDILNIVP